MSNLLKNSLLQANPHLSKRVHSAVIQVAQQQSSAGGVNEAFAHVVLNDLSRSWSEFMLNASADVHIQAASVINEDATAIVTTGVNDEQIMNVINSTWATAATKYAPQPAGDTES